MSHLFVFIVAIEYVTMHLGQSLQMIHMEVQWLASFVLLTADRHLTSSLGHVNIELVDRDLNKVKFPSI